VSAPRVRLAAGLADLAAVYAIRHTVFVREQGVPVELERDDRDAGADHFVAVLKGEAVGAVRMVIEPAGFEGVEEGLGAVAHLGRLAVRQDARRAGLGALLVRAVERRVTERGLRVVYLGSQTHAVGFYTGLGYVAYGQEFDDAGLPHRHMARVLTLGESGGMPRAAEDLMRG
jgi:predicted GNAT family N-acyltransferase